MSEYSRLDRALHYLALNFQAVRVTSFDIERGLTRANGKQVASQPHVFVTGLARAGTSILLRTLHSSGCFASQTYRDMPFILAPRLWRKLSGSRRVAGTPEERAHADGLMVDFSSVEAFEEVFWLTFAGESYLREDHMRAHSVDPDLASLFRDFVAVVISAHGPGGPDRYLSKNNNNLLRLAGLAGAFPAARIVVPFRTPIRHAQSLLRLHRLFGESQRADPFFRSYMRWLGHFEFGCDYRPFEFGDDAPATGNSDTESLDHWVGRWASVYRGALATAPDDAIFWDHDAFCADPEGMMTALAERLDLDRGFIGAAVADIRPASGGADGDDLPAAVLADAHETHAALRDRALRPHV